MVSRRDKKNKAQEMEGSRRRAENGEASENAMEKLTAAAMTTKKEAAPKEVMSDNMQEEKMEKRKWGGRSTRGGRFEGGGCGSESEGNPMQYAVGKDEATEGACGGGYEGQKVKDEELVENMWRETRRRWRG